MQISAISDRLNGALLDFAWDEWAQMGVSTARHSRRRWAQDPEALLLLTFEVAREDPRLFDEVLGWYASNAPLLSARRLRTLCENADDQRVVGAVSAWAKQLGRPPEAAVAPTDDGAGEPLFRGSGMPVLRRDPAFAAFGLLRPPVRLAGKSRAPDATLPINFALRLRQLLGVGTRAEVIRYLLTAEVESASVSQVAASTGFARRNIHEALNSLAAAKVVRVKPVGGEQRFGVDRARWSYLLGLDAEQLPVYVDWPELFGAVRRLLRWCRAADTEALSDYMRTSSAAELVDEVRPRLNRAGLFPATTEGERTLGDLEQIVDCVVDFLSPTRSGQQGRGTYEITTDAQGRSRWRLTTPAGRILVIASESHATRAAAVAAVDRIRAVPRRVEFSVTSDEDTGAYRWRIVAENGRVLGSSTEALASFEDAERAARAGREISASAEAPGEAHGPVSEIEGSAEPVVDLLQQP